MLRISFARHGVFRPLRPGSVDREERSSSGSCNLVATGISLVSFITFLSADSSEDVPFSGAELLNACRPDLQSILALVIMA